MSNIYHVQSIFPSAQTRPDSREQQLVVTVRSPVRGLGQVEELQEMVGGGVEAEGEELFALEGVPPVYSHYSEEEREESEPDEGIHIPAKFREKKLTEVNYNFNIINPGRQCTYGIFSLVMFFAKLVFFNFSFCCFNIYV